VRFKNRPFTMHNVPDYRYGANYGCTAFFPLGANAIGRTGDSEVWTINDDDGI